MNQYKQIGIDLANQVFQICALNQAGKAVFNRKVKRREFAEVMQQIPASRVAMEACGSAHYWARRLVAMGHDVKLIPAQHVKPFTRGNKNDHNDALAICEAAQRPGMHFVPIKTVEDLDVQMVHRIREAKKKYSTALCNQIRAFLRENGIIIPKGKYNVLKQVPLILEDADNALTVLARELIHELYEDLKASEEKLKALDQVIKRQVAGNDDCQRLLEIPGYGPVIVSTLVTTIGKGQAFKNGRQLSAWAGLTPRHVGTGGKNTILSTSKGGNRYLRYLLIHGARTVVRWSERKDDPLSRWVQQLVQRRGKQKAIVALANKSLRIAWVVLARNASYKSSMTTS